MYVRTYAQKQNHLRNQKFKAERRFEESVGRKIIRVLEEKELLNLQNVAFEGDFAMQAHVFFLQL